MSSISEKLSISEKIGYSLGDLAANLVFQTLMTYLAYFYTDIYGLEANDATAIIFFVGTIAAIGFNPIVGLLPIELIPSGVSLDLGFYGQLSL